MAKPNLADQESNRPIISLYLDGIKEAIQTTDDSLDRDEDGMLSPEEVQDRIGFLIPDRGSKWLVIGHVRFNTFNLKAVTVE